MKYLIFLLPLTLLLVSCDPYALRSDLPLRPVREYERMLVGRLDADYVGTEQCLARCHQHDGILKNFRHSVHGAQIEVQSGLPLVNCETCHGPGSLAIANLTDASCDFSTFIQIAELPAPAQSLICLKCHSVSSTPALHYWSAGAHAVNDVSCIDCHNLHQGPQQKVSRKEMAELCYGCHQHVRMEFSQFSHHPVPEERMVCIDCHDPHGSAQDSLLHGHSVKEMCTRCHMEHQGPFVYEHADVTEDCSTCHVSHGSPNDPLLTVNQPFLCMQCHAGHHGRGDLSARGTLSTPQMKTAFYTRCTDCHSAIHGSDTPSAHGRGSFIAR